MIRWNVTMYEAPMDRGNRERRRQPEVCIEETSTPIFGHPPLTSYLLQQFMRFVGLKTKVAVEG